MENIEIHHLHHAAQQPVFNQTSQACALPAVPRFQLSAKPDRQANLTGARLKTTAYTRDFQKGVPYPTRGGVGEIYLDPSRIMIQAASQVAEGHESEYSSFTNPVFSSTDMGPNLPR